ncbi:putative envelope-like protein, partial [Trifolium pratense]
SVNPGVLNDIAGGDTEVKEEDSDASPSIDNPLSPEYLKVYVRGKCVDFSPAIINQHLGRCDVPAPELEISMNEVCKTITGDKVRMWPRAGKLSAAKLTTKYALLNKIAAANWVPTTHSNSVATGLA